MNIVIEGDTLTISGMEELTAAEAPAFKEDARAGYGSDVRHIDIDCGDLKFIDSSGLGALISLQKMTTERGGSLRLLRPSATVTQLLEFTRLHRVFTIVLD